MVIFYVVSVVRLSFPDFHLQVSSSSAVQFFVSRPEGGVSILEAGQPGLLVGIIQLPCVQPDPDVQKPSTQCE